MSKVMLIMDKPNACIKCSFCFKADEMSMGNFEYKRLYSCKHIPSDVEGIYLEDILHKKPDWCPLKDVPKKRTAQKYKNPLKSWINGWNACIDEILKEDK